MKPHIREMHFIMKARRFAHFIMKTPDGKKPFLKLHMSTKGLLDPSTPTAAFSLRAHTSSALHCSPTLVWPGKNDMRHKKHNNCFDWGQDL